MSCRQSVSKVLIFCATVYLLLYVDKPILPDSVRLPVVEQINTVCTRLLEIADPLLKLVGLDAASRGGESYTAPAKFHDVPTISNDEELNAALAKYEMIFLMAHAPWCGHCKNMHRDYASLYDQISNDFVNFPDNKMGVFAYNAASECKSNPKSCKIESLSQSIRGFPTLLLVESNENKKPVATLYGQQRTSEQMRQFLLDQVREPITGEDAEQAQIYFGQFKEGVLHYVPTSMSLKEAKKKASGFSMRQQIFTRTFDVIKHFEPTHQTLAEDQHIMLAFGGQKYSGIIPNNSPATVPQIVTMYAHNAIGKFSDKAFLSLGLPRFLLLTRLRSNDGDHAASEAFLSNTFTQPQLVGQAVVLLFEQTEEDDKIAYMIGMSDYEGDCMVLFDQMTSKRYGICLESASNSMSIADFTNHWLKAISGELSESNDANYEQNFKGVSNTKPIVLCKENIDEFLTKHEQALVFTFSVAKHSDSNVKKFKSLRLKNMPMAIVDMTLDQGLKSKLVDAKIEDREKILYFANQKLVDTYTGEVDHTLIEKFIVESQTTSTKAASSTDDL